MVGDTLNKVAASAGKTWSACRGAKHQAPVSAFVVADRRFSDDAPNSPNPRTFRGLPFNAQVGAA